MTGIMLIDYMIAMVVMVSMGTTTISISDEMRRELVRVAAELQARLGERIDYDQVIRYLVSRAMRNERLLREACVPIRVSSEEARRELRKGRLEDRKREEALGRAYA